MTVPVSGRRKSWRQLREIQRGRRESKRMNKTPQGAWLGGAQKGSLCYAGSLAEKQKSEISGKRHRPKPTP